MAVRQADAVWEGTLREGKGTMKMASGAYEGAYSFPSRFEEGNGTNPEELIAAAHAGCFSMALSGGLTRAGFEPQKIATTAKVHLTNPGDGWRISQIELITEATVPGISDEQFQEAAEAAKQNCPISKALGAVETITLAATLR